MISKYKTEIVWNIIVNNTENSSYPEYKGLRNALFLSTNRNKSIKKFIFHIKSILFILIKPKKHFNYQIPENKILFYFPFHSSANFNNLNPVYELTKKHNLDGLVIKTRKVNLSEGLRKETLYQFVSIKKRYGAFFKTLIANHKLYRTFGKTIIDYFYFENLYLLFQVYVNQFAFESILKQTKPVSVVSTSDYFPIDFALFNTANKLNIPNYMIQHGIVGVSHVPFTAGKYVVQGQFTKEQLIKMDTDESRIISGGMPSTDKIFINKKENRDVTDIKRVLILSDTQGAVIYPEIYEQYFKTIKNIVEENTDINFLVKLHPAENLSLYEQNGLLKINNLTFLPKSTSLNDSFQQADLAMTIWSTAGLEAMIYGLPLLVLDVNPYVQKIAWWPKYGGGIFYSEIDPSMVSNFNFNILESQDRFLKINFLNQGESRKYIYNIISQC